MNKAFMKKIAPSGDTATRKKYGQAHFVKLAHKRWKKTKLKDKV